MISQYNLLKSKRVQTHGSDCLHKSIRPFILVHHLKQPYIPFNMTRRRSIDSSDSDSSHKSHKDKKHKEHKHHKDHSHNYMSDYGSPVMPNYPATMSQFPPSHASSSVPYPSGHGSPATAHFPSEYAAMPNFPSPHDSSSVPPFPLSHGIDQKSTKFPGTDNQNTLSSGGPPPYTAAPAPPSSGFRLPLTTTGAFPDPQTLGQPPCYDLDGSPIYIGSALLGNSVHPCKIGKHLQPCVAVPYGGVEHGHHGRYDLLPYRPDQMEFVPTSYGKIPYGRRPIEGGYEDHGAKLYHAVALINGLRVPGKTSEHLGGCNVSFGGAEHVIQGSYEILCWR